MMMGGYMIVDYCELWHSNILLRVLADKYMPLGDRRLKTTEADIQKAPFARSLMNAITCFMKTAHVFPDWYAFGLRGNTMEVQQDVRKKRTKGEEKTKSEGAAPIPPILLDRVTPSRDLLTFSRVFGPPCMQHVLEMCAIGEGGQPRHPRHEERLLLTSILKRTYRTVDIDEAMASTLFEKPIHQRTAQEWRKATQTKASDMARSEKGMGCSRVCANGLCPMTSRANARKIIDSLARLGLITNARDIEDLVEKERQSVKADEKRNPTQMAMMGTIKACAKLCRRGGMTSNRRVRSGNKDELPPWNPAEALQEAAATQERGDFLQWSVPASIKK